jgi:hypothetical protein
MKIGDMMPISSGQHGNAGPRKVKMVFRFVFLAAALSALDVHAVFGGPLSQSAAREAAKLAAASARHTHANKRMAWTGVAIAGTGVALAEIAFHKANVSSCPGSTVRGCDENLNGGLLAAGTVAILAGSILTVVGALPIHAELTAGPGEVVITRRVTF